MSLVTERISTLLRGENLSETEAHDIIAVVRQRIRKPMTTAEIIAAQIKVDFNTIYCGRVGPSGLPIDPEAPIFGSLIAAIAIAIARELRP